MIIYCIFLEQGKKDNSVHLPYAEVPKCTVPSDNDSQIAAKLSKALSMNARLIRRGVSEFRSSPVNSMRALERQARMVDLPEAKVAAAFVVKGADMKVASTTAVTAFPFTNVSQSPYD